MSDRDDDGDVTTRPPGSVATFYSWKGGVGRTMVLANVAVQLARMGSRVLVVDWDLEAPGLERYFINLEQRPAANLTGLMGLLCEASNRGDAASNEQDWRDRLVIIQVPEAPSTLGMQTLSSPSPIHFLPSGYGSEGYAKSLSEFSWTKFFADSRGGEWLEELRDQWCSSYHFVLIDSRTGLTDSGGVCTIQMPHTLVLVFTASDQSVDGGLRIVAAAQHARRDFGYDRGPLVVIPVLSRWEGEKEVDIGEEWMKRLDTVLAPLTAPWLPKDFSPRQFVEKTRVPHVPLFTFGEPLPVISHSLSDPGLPGMYFDTIARLIQSQLSNVGRIIDPSYTDKPIGEVGDRTIAEGRTIFVSYRRLDDEPPPDGPYVDDPKHGFVNYLLRQIRYDLIQMGVTNPILWQDRSKIAPADDFNEDTKNALKTSDLFLVILSQNYLTSQWCKREFSEIVSRAEMLGTPAGASIFRVDKQPISDDEIPEPLRSIQAVRFYREDPYADRVDDYFWRGRVRYADEYERAVKRLAEGIYKRLKELGFQFQQKDESKRPELHKSPSNGRVVFVAKPAGDMGPSYQSLVAKLRGAGYRVTPDPDKDLGKLGEEVQSIVAAALSEAEASIHLLGTRTGGRPDGLYMDLVPMQLAAAAKEAAKKSGFERMIWAPDVLPGTSATSAEARRDPLEVLNRFGQRLLATDQIVSDTASRFNEFVLQHLAERHRGPSTSRSSPSRASRARRRT
jgi:MinD-like ATPase involved in chromosome partitioning or flagellar assembly